MTNDLNVLLYSYIICFINDFCKKYFLNKIIDINFFKKFLNFVNQILV